MSSPQSLSSREHVSSDPPLVLLVSFPYAPVGPAAVGGAEVVLSEIEAALPSLGFRSVVVAHADSQPQGQLYPVTVPSGEINDDRREQVEHSAQTAIDQAVADHPVSVVHLHGLDFHRYRFPPWMPILVTLHLPPSWYPDSIWTLPYNYRFICVSQTERQVCPKAMQHRLSVVENGVPLPDPATLRSQGRYALILSRICREKNLHVALQAAKLAAMPALLAGEVFAYPDHQRYFAEEIAPRLTHSGEGHEVRGSDTGEPSGARFLGPVTGAAKTKLLTRAACLLLPSLAPETSSLVAMEALAAGVPVIAMRCGAIPEVVEDGVTGFLIEPGPDTAAHMAQAMHRIGDLDRFVCRSTAERRFDIHTMLERYGKLYRTCGLPDSTPYAPAYAASISTASPAETVTVATEVLHCETVTEAQALHEIAELWTAVWCADPHASPFQHPAWLLPWWRQFGPDGELRAIAVWNDRQELRGLLPLYLCKAPDAGEPKILLLGAGTSDYLDGVWYGAAGAKRIAAIALQTAMETCPDLLNFNLTQLRANSPLRTAAQVRSAPWYLQESESEPCSVIGTVQHLPAKVAANARRYRRRAEAQGELRFSVAETEEQALCAFESLAHLHRQRWRGEPQGGVLEDPRVMAHHRQAIPALLHAGLLRMFVLHLGETLLGVLYALADPDHKSQRSLYLYLIGFELGFADLSPGTLLLHAVWEHACEHGFEQLDLLRGGEMYKQHWGAQRRSTFSLRLVAGSGAPVSSAARNALAPI